MPLMYTTLANSLNLWSTAAAVASATAAQNPDTQYVYRCVVQTDRLLLRHRNLPQHISSVPEMRLLLLLLSTGQAHRLCNVA
jgi:hypothetical protein